MSDRIAPNRLRSAVVLPIGLLLPFIVGCGAKPFDAESASRLDRSFYDERFTVGRLAGSTVWRACGPRESRSDSTCSATIRTKKDFDRLASKFQLAQQRLDTDSSRAALRDAGLLALRLRDSSANGLTDAVRFLDRARRSPRPDAGILNDFAVAQLELGERQDERQKDIRPYLAALDAIQRSLIADSSLVPALFNRALILERLNLLATAQRAWARYLTVETDSAWRREARSHKSRLARVTNANLLLQSGRDRVFKLLGEWGRATGNGDTARAAAMLDTAKRVVASLDTLYADRSPQLALATVDSLSRRASQSEGERSSLQRLAGAHVALSDGLLARGRSLDRAAKLLGEAEEELRTFGSAAAGWAAFNEASVEMDSSLFDAADAHLQRVADGASVQQIALRGKAIATRGVIQVRRGNFELANQFYHEAAPYLVQAKEPENVGGISYLLSESLSSAGQYAAGGSEAYRGLRLLAPYRKSNYLHNQLATIAVYARTDSLPFAALAVMDEVLGVAAEMGNPDPLALDYRTRARDLISVGRRDSAHVALQIGMQTTERLGGGLQARRRADLRLIQGQLMRTDDPRGALDLLDTVANEYRRFGAFSKASAALYETAMVAQAAGDTLRARDLLRDAITQIERQQSTFQSLEGRAALFETADNAFDAMIDLQLRAGHPDSAFNYLERERAAAKPAPSNARSAENPGEIPSLASIQRLLRDDMLFVEYALLRDRASVWVASRNGKRQFDVPVPRDAMAALVEQFRRESAIPTPREGDARSRLFELLFHPLEKDLRGIKQIAVVSDRELAGLPFAALWDAGRRRYVIEDYSVRTEPSAAFFSLAVKAVALEPKHRRTALVIGNPLLDSTLGLPSLPAAEVEARRVSSLYSNATLLLGPSARRDTVLTLLETPTVLHFAGHAVFNPDRPELSYLALGAPRSSRGTGVLEAREIAGLRLPNLEIVVLSACQTLSSRTSRTGGVAGLASSFLRAGAPAIVSTLWDVNDDVTEPLVAAFHENFAAGRPADDALRRAQLRVLKTGSGQRAAPAIWAAFIYAGP
jgi:CHAT domain-containing protein